MPAKTSLLFTFRLIPMIGGMLATRGIDAAELLRETGLPPDAMRGEITAPLHRVQAFIAKAAKAGGGDTFGLDLAHALPGGVYGIAEFLIRSAPSTDAAVRALCDFAALINPIGLFKWVRRDAEGELHYSVASQRDTLGLHLNEFTIAYIVKQFSSVIDGGMPLVRAWFSHSRPTGGEDVAKRLGCDVRFQAPDCGFAVSRAVLDKAPRSADPLLFQFLEGQAKAQLARIGPIDIVTQLVRVLEARLPSGDVGANAVAKAMASTPRSLQRHLSDAGTTYRDVLAHVRNRRRNELRGGGIGETEIAHQLGFSDARAMRRSLDE